MTKMTMAATTTPPTATPDPLGTGTAPGVAYSTSTHRRARPLARRVHVLGAPLEGGVVHQVLDLARFDPLGPPEVLLPPWPGLDRAARRIAATGARVHRVPPAPRPGGVAQWLAASGVDLVHVHYATAHDGTDAIEAALEAGIPCLSTDHACPPDDAGDRRWERRRRFAPRQWTIVADSDAVGTPLAARLGCPVRVLRHGIDPRAYASLPERRKARRRFAIPESARVVGSIGALFSSKGMHRVLEAGSRLGPEVVLLLVGEGPERPRLEALARSLGIEARLPGWLDDVRPALAAMDVLALASESEGLPTVVLQAMAAGVPVVGSDIGGVREALGPYGVKVATQDLAGWCEALAAALDVGSAAPLHGARSRVQEHFDVRRLARRIAALHCSALGLGGGASLEAAELGRSQPTSADLSPRRTEPPGPTASRGSS